jgi:hypothetical protein
MVRIALALAAAIALTPRDARADEWTRADTVTEAAFVAVVLMDWQQTRRALGAVAGHALIARLLPRPYRAGWQYVTIAVEVGAVANNATHVGLRFGF